MVKIALTERNQIGKVPETTCLSSSYEPEMRFQTYPNTCEADLVTLRNVKVQKHVHKISAGHGTPMLLTLRKIRGALPSAARENKVRDLWKSLFSQSRVGRRCRLKMGGETITYAI